MTQCYKFPELYTRIYRSLSTNKGAENTVVISFQNVAKGLLLILKKKITRLVVYLHHLFESVVKTLKLTAFYVQVTLLDVKWKVPQVHVAVHSNRISKNRIKRITFNGSHFIGLHR